MSDVLPKPDDDCPHCADHWDNQDKPRKKLVRIGTTQNHKIVVVACPYCDGERAIELSLDRKK